MTLDGAAGRFPLPPSFFLSMCMHRQLDCHVLCGCDTLSAFLMWYGCRLVPLLDVPATKMMFECLKQGDASRLQVCERQNLLLVEFNTVSCSSRSIMEPGAWTRQGYWVPSMYHSMAGQYTWVLKSWGGSWLNSRGLCKPTKKGERLGWFDWSVWWDGSQEWFYESNNEMLRSSRIE